MHLIMLIIWLGLIATGMILAAKLARVVVRHSLDAYPRRVGRLMAAILLGAALGVTFHYDYATKRLGGKAAFLESQGHRFDMFIAKPRLVVAEILLCVVVMCAVCAAYELLAWGFDVAARRPTKGGAA
jgi:hypothetical protein